MALSDIFATPENEDVTPRRKFGGSDVAAGAEVGLRGLQSGYYNLPLVEDPAAAAYAGAQAASTPVQFRSSDDVNFLDPSQVIDFAQQNLGQLGVSTLPTLATGGFGAAVGRKILGAAAENLTKAELARRAATIANSGRAGAVVGGTAQAYGEQAGELRDNGMEPGAFTGLTSLASGLGNAFGLENAFKSLITNAGEEAVKAGARSRAASLAMGAGKGLLTTGGIETATELGDESLAIANRAWYDPKYRDNTDDMWHRAKETAISTMAGAGLMGGTSGAVGGMRSPLNTQPLTQSEFTPDAASHDMSLDELRQFESSTPSTGDTYGQSQDSAPQTPNANETGQRQEVLKPAGASAPANLTGEEGDRVRFVESMTPYAVEASRRTGIPVDVLLTHASLETDWGRRAPGNNYFGIKGKGQKFATHEVINGQRVAVNDSFRAYNDPQESFNDLADLLQRRYPKALGATDALAYGQALKAGGYATDPEYAAKMKGRFDALQKARQKTGAAPTTVRYTPEQTAAEVGEVVRRQVAGEPTQQDTTLGRAIKEAQGQPLGSDMLTTEDQSAPSDDGDFQNTTEGFTLTEKGRKYESTGEDIFKPARPIPEAAPNEMEGVTAASTPTRAFQVAYPGSEINVSDDRTVRKVSVTFPEDQRDAIGDGQKAVARAMFDAFNSGAKAGQETKILLEHPEVLSKNTDNPIEIPVTRDSLIKLGKALDPGAYDDTPASAHAAAVSGMTHLIYDKGFQPRGVDATKPKLLNKWVAEKLGKPPVDRRPERATPETQDRLVSGPVIGNARREGQAPATDVGGFTGEEPSTNPEYEAAPSYTPMQQAVLNHITVAAKKIQTPLPPEATDEDRAKAWESAVNQVVRTTNPADIRVAPETAHYELGAKGQPQRVVTQSDTGGVPGNANVDAAVLGQVFDSPDQARQALASAGYEALPLLKGPRKFIATKEANKSTFRLVKTSEGKFRLTTPDKPRRGLARPTVATRQDLLDTAELAKKEFSSALYSRRKGEEQAVMNQEAGVSNNDMTTLEQDATEDQTLSTEAALGRAEDRAQMAQRQRGLTSTFSPSQAKAQVRRSSEATTSRMANAANKPRDIGDENLETVHKVSGGSTVRATGVSDKVVQFFTKALTDIGLQVPIRVTSRAGLQQHADALQQRIEALSTSIMELSTQIKELPELTKEQKAEKKILRDRLRLAERRMSDATTEQTMLIQAMEDSFAARVIYNDHYMDASGRTPIIVVSDEALSSSALSKVLGHELGHIVQRAWFDQLPTDMKAEILNELSENGLYTDDIPENFANKFYEWYERTARGEKIKQKQSDYQSTGMDNIFRQLMNALQRLWKNLTSHDKSFSKTYPKFDEFLRSTVGVYGKMKPVNPDINRVWAESLSQPYGGLPLRVADTSKFDNMTVPELQDAVETMAGKAKDRAAKYAESKIGQNQVAKDYQRRLGETYDVMKTGANFLFMSEGFRLRHSWGGIFAGWGNIYAPEMGKNLEGMQVISGTLHTNRVTGRALNMLKRMRSRYNGKLENIHKQLKGLSEQEQQALLENLQNENLPPSSPLAKEIRSYFRSIWAGLRAHEVSVGKLKDYFPKAWDAEMFADSAKRDEIVARFTALFKSRNELPVKERVKVPYEDDEGRLHYKWHDVRYETAEAAAIDTYNRISRNEIDPFTNATDYGADNNLRSSAFPNNRPRPFSDKEYRDFKLYDFLNKDIGYVMQMYTNQATQRMMQQSIIGIPRNQRNPKQNAEAAAAWAKRFEDAGLEPGVMHSSTAALDLLLAEGFQDGRIPREEYDRAKSLITSTLGQKNVGVSPRLRRWNNRIVAYQTILTMGWSMFSSLSDFGIAAWRGDSLSRASESFKKLLDKTTRQQQEELLKTLGLALDETTRHALQMDTAAVGDPIARFSQNLTEKFFRLNGMEFLSHSNMIFSSLLGQSYIKDYSNQAVNGATQEIRDAAMDRLKKLHPEFDPAIAMTQNFESDTMMQLALMEFISQSHLHDQQGYTPEYFQDHRFRLLTMLKGFTFKYHNIVLKQMWEKMKDQPDLLRATMPVVTLAIATMPLALLGMETKDFLRRKLMPKVKRYKEKTAAETLHDVVMASGMPGMYVSMFDDMLEAPKHGQPWIISLMGPAVGTVYNMSARTADEYLPGMTPLVASFPWMRSKMREGLRDTFGFGVRDEEE